MIKKTILITGCSSGIGLCAARSLHQRGYHVFATVRKEADKKLLEKEGIECFLMNIKEKASITQTVEAIHQRTQGKLFALFNNAGYLEAGAIEDLSSERIRAQFETNVFGAMELIRQVLPLMRHNGKGRIIQNSSILGIVTIPYCGAYNASKFALEGFSNTLRQELRGSNIYVSCINPGAILSELRNTAHKHFNQAQIEKSNYSSIYTQMAASYFQGKNKLALPPEKVVTKLYHALESKHPKAHYYVSFTAHLTAFLRRILSDSALDWLLSKSR